MPVYRTVLLTVKPFVPRISIDVDAFTHWLRLLSPQKLELNAWYCFVEAE